MIMWEYQDRWMALPPQAERIHMGCPVMDARSLRGGRPVIRHVPVQAMRDDVLVDRCVFFEVAGVITGHDGAIRHDDAARVSDVVVPTCKGEHQPVLQVPRTTLVVASKRLASEGKLSVAVDEDHAAVAEGQGESGDLPVAKGHHSHCIVFHSSADGVDVGHVSQACQECNGEMPTAPRGQVAVALGSEIGPRRQRVGDLRQLRRFDVVEAVAVAPPGFLDEIDGAGEVGVKCLGALASDEIK